MTEGTSGRPIYSIGAVSRLLGIPVPTLRSWEDRYGLVRPERSSGGQRLFSRNDVERLRFISEQVQAGMQPADAHRMLEDRSAGEVSTMAPDGRRLLILLAERDPYAAEFAEYFLRTEGYDVRMSFDALEAEDVFQAATPDLVVIDWLISGGAGADLCRDLRSRTGTPILVISSIDTSAAAVAAGADAFLRKPLDGLQFVSTVRDLLGDSAFARAHARPA